MIIPPKARVSPAVKMAAQRMCLTSSLTNYRDALRRLVGSYLSTSEYKPFIKYYRAFVPEEDGVFLV
jgi:hypothetical protein